MKYPIFWCGRLRLHCHTQSLTDCCFRMLALKFHLCLNIFLSPPQTNIHYFTSTLWQPCPLCPGWSGWPRPRPWWCCSTWSRLSHSELSRGNNWSGLKTLKTSSLVNSSSFRQVTCPQCGVSLAELRGGLQGPAGGHMEDVPVLHRGAVPHEVLHTGDAVHQITIS